MNEVRNTALIYIVLGEESGDALASDLLPALQEAAAQRNIDIEVVGLAGTNLQKQGVTSLFNIQDIAVMGITAVLARLPKIVRRVHQTVDDIIAKDPTLLLLIDSPDFTHAVAKRVRKRLPDLPVVNYVCPSVWAWRSGRAKAMRAYVDHVLAILPFEPKVLQELSGPPATYIGHPLARQIASQDLQRSETKDAKPILLVLPGSRRSELKRMLAPFGDTLTVLRDRGAVFDPILPAVPHLKDYIIEETANWTVKPRIVDSADNDKHFANARAALATSGTVALQLALHRVPMVSGFKIDPLARQLSSLISTWSALLPNLIVDRLIVPEEFNELVLPQRMARYLERLLADTPERAMQLQGFDELATAMQTKKPPNELAAQVIFELIEKAAPDS